MTRELYLVAYDIREPKRLHKVHKILKEFSCGGQKSAFECYLTDGERKELITRAEQCMDLDEDSLLVIALIDRDAVSTLGIATKPVDELYTYLG